MAWDFTLSTGNKTGASRRTSGASFERGGTKVNRTVTKEAPTTIADPGNSPLIKAAHTMGDFFGQASAKETEAMIAKEKERNDEAIVEATRRVLADPEGAREAIRSGDFSKFFDDDELRSRKVVQEGFMKSVAEQSAVKAFDDEGRAFINNLPADANVDEAYQQWLAQRVEGTSPVYADAFMAQGIKASQPIINNFKNKRYAHMVEQSKQAFQGAAEKIFSDPTTPKDPKAIEGQILKASSGMMMPTPMRVMEARKIAAQVAMQNVTNPAAYNYVNTVPIDPTNPNSLTIAEHYAVNNLGTTADFMDKGNHKDRNKITADQNDELSVYEEVARTNPVLSIAGIENMLHGKRVHELNDRLAKLRSMVKTGIKDHQKQGLWLQFMRDPSGTINNASPDQIADIKKINDSMSEEMRIKAAQQAGIAPGVVSKALGYIDENGMASKADIERRVSQVINATKPQDIARALQGFQRHRQMMGTTGANYFGNSPEGKKAFMIAQLYDVMPTRVPLLQEKLRGYTGNFESPWSLDRGDGKSALTDQGAFDKLDDRFKSMGGTLKKQVKGAMAAAYIMFGSNNWTQISEAVDMAFPEESLATRQVAPGVYTKEAFDTTARQYTEDELETGNKVLNDESYADRHHPQQPKVYVSGIEGKLGGSVIYRGDSNIPVSYQPGKHQHYNSKEEIPKELAAVGTIHENPDGKFTVEINEPKKGESFVRKGEKNVYAAWNGHAWEAVYSVVDLTKAQQMKGPTSKRLVQYLEHRKAAEGELNKATAVYQSARGGARGGAGLRMEDARNKVAELQTKIETMIKMQGSSNGIILSTLKQYKAAFGGGEVIDGMINSLETKEMPHVVGEDEDDEAEQTLTKVTDTIHEDKKLAQKKNLDIFKSPDVTYEGVAEKFLLKHEGGLVPGVYQDTNKAKSIGAGFNLDNAETAATVKKYGYNIQSLKNGEQMDPGKARLILRDLYKQKRQKLVTKMGIDDWVELSDYEQIAMISLTYNSEEAGLGQYLTGALKTLAEARRTKDKALELRALEEVNLQMRYFSLPIGKMIEEGNAKWIDGLWYRRNSEADMFLQGNINKPDGSVQFPLRKNNWREEPEFKALLHLHRSKNAKTWPKFDPQQIINQKRETRKTDSPYRK